MIFVGADGHPPLRYARQYNFFFVYFTEGEFP